MLPSWVRIYRLTAGPGFRIIVVFLLFLHSIPDVTGFSFFFHQIQPYARLSSSSWITRRIKTCQQPLSTPAAAAAAAASEASTPLPASVSGDDDTKFLVLFKGGAANNADEGTSLSCLRLAEFNGLARAVLDRKRGHVNAMTEVAFRSALRTDVSLAAGRRPDEGLDDDDGSNDPSSSLMYIDGIDSPEALKEIASRAILVHAAYEIWGLGETMEESAAQTGKLTDTDDRLLPLIQQKSSWAAKALVFGEKYGCRKSLTDLPMKLSIFRKILERLPGPVDLKNPDVQLVLLEDGDTAEEDEVLHQVFFTRQLSTGAQGLTQKLSLKRRAYVSTTSMDAKTSLVMCNVAGLLPGDKVLDPFAGSGGLLLAAAELGAGTTVGVDVNATIDLTKVWGNFEQLSLPPPSAYFLGDSADSKIQAQLAEFGPFDVILADPPYGKREKGSKKAEGAMEEAAYTLLTLAASNDIFKVGGRMTFFVPAHPSCQDIISLLPSHPCLTVEDQSRQPLNANLNRWLVTLVKTRASLPEDVIIEPSSLLLQKEEEGENAGGREDLRLWHYRPSSPSASIHEK